jgi:HTH-type transcriptional regulator/antitoxin HigA
MTDVVPAEAFPPGEFLADELSERGWTQKEFADLTGLSPRLVSEIIGGKRSVTPEAAIRFSAALGSSAQFWMNLDTAYRLYQLHRTAPAPAGIAREARLRENFPVREMIQRGWVKESGDAEVLEARVLGFYGLTGPDERRVFAFAARRGGDPKRTALSQEAWLYRVKQVAEGIHVGRYSEAALREAVGRLSALRSAPEEARQVPRILAECGVRFAIVEPITGSRIDGACFWLDAAAKPVIGMSMRVDRIDNFWFVLRHEIEHVLRGDGREAAIVDTALCDATDRLPDERPEEVAANRAAADFCVSLAALDDFLAGVGSAVAEERILLFAKRLGVHPGLVVGQVQWRLQRFNFLRKYLVKIRDMVLPGATTDGYGRHLIDVPD